MCEMTREKYIALLKKWDDEYYNNGKPSVVDTEYDRIRSAFRAKYPNDPYFKSVGTAVKFAKIKIPFKMGGLDKMNSDTLRGWLNGKAKEIVVSEKLDGNSIAVTWTDGKMTFACSRGTDNEGQDILEKARCFVPTIPAIKGKITLRGEAFLEGDAYKELGYQNRRNGTTGIIRKDTIIPSKLRKLSVMFYEVIEAPKTMKLESERMNYIEKVLNLRTPIWSKIKSDDKTEDTLCRILANAKANANYDIDGLVLTIDNSVRENVSIPKSKVAFKVNQEAEKCKVTHIEWSVTRLGKIAPVICIEPTTMGGVTVHRASGFNAQYIESEGIDKGAVVGVVRSGDVIPYVTEVFQAVKAVIPTKCPSCNKSLKRNDIDVICVNDGCVQKQIYNTAHYFKTIGANFITDRTIEMMGIATIEEAYKLTVKDLEKREGIGSKKAELIISEIKKTLNIKPEKLLDAFGMPMIGTRHSKTLLGRFTFDELFTIKDTDVIGLGEITGQTLIDNIGKYKPLYKFLQKQGLTFIKETKSMSKVTGLKFAVTGAGNLKRKDYEEMAESKGAVIKSISKDTNFLVTDTPDSGSAKNKAAQKLGIPIITYDEFEKMLRG